jgi:hypothetical protein
MSLWRGTDFVNRAVARLAKSESFMFALSWYKDNQGREFEGVWSKTQGIYIREFDKTVRDRHAYAHEYVLKSDKTLLTLVGDTWKPVSDGAEKTDILNLLDFCALTEMHRWKDHMEPAFQKYIDENFPRHRPFGVAYRPQEPLPARQPMLRVAGVHRLPVSFTPLYYC